MKSSANSNEQSSNRRCISLQRVSSEPDDNSKFIPFQVYKKQNIYQLDIKYQSENLIEKPSSYMSSQRGNSIFLDVEEEIRQKDFVLVQAEKGPLQNEQPLVVLKKPSQPEEKNEGEQEAKQYYEVPHSPQVEEEKINEDSQKPKTTQFAGGFLKLMLQRRITLNFKNNLMQRAYVLSNKNMNKAKHELLQEEFTKKADKKTSKNSRRKKTKVQKSPETMKRGITKFEKLFSKPTQKKNFKIGVIDPGNKFMVGWEFMKIFLILIIFWWLPFNMSFQPEITSEVEQVQIFLLAFFSLDILLKFNRGIISQGQIVKQRNKILQYYIKNEAVYDLLSFASITVLFLTSVEQLPFLLIYFILNTAKINRGIAKIQESFYFQGTLKHLVDLIRLVLVVFVFAHLIACTWHYVGENSVTDGKSWIVKYGLEHQSIGTRYNFSMYWAAMTMITVGYGDITPQNNKEMLMVNITMFIACGVFAFSVNSIGIVLQNINEGKSQFKRTMTLINNYMNKNSVGFELQSRVRNYLEYCFEQEQEINDEEISELLGKLSTSLKQELLFQVLSKVLTSCKMISTNFSEATQRKVACLMEPVRHCPDDKILTQDELDDASLYIIQKGEVLLYEETSKKKFKVLKKNDSFGEFGFFTGMTRSCSVTSQGFSRVYKIKREAFLDVIKDNKGETERFHEIKDQLIFNLSVGTQVKCYCCDKDNHLVVNCQQLRFLPDLERIIKKDMFHSNQERNYYLRADKAAKLTKRWSNMKLYQDQSKSFKNNTEVSDEYSEKSQEEGEYTKMVSMVNGLESGIPNSTSQLDLKENTANEEKIQTSQEELAGIMEQESQEEILERDSSSLEKIFNRKQVVNMTSGTAQFSDMANLNSIALNQQGSDNSMLPQLQVTLPQRRQKVVTIAGDDIQPFLIRQEQNAKKITLVIPDQKISSQQGMQESSQGSIHHLIIKFAERVGTPLRKRERKKISENQLIPQKAEDADQLSTNSPSISRINKHQQPSSQRQIQQIEQIPNLSKTLITIDQRRQSGKQIEEQRNVQFAEDQQEYDEEDNEEYKGLRKIKSGQSTTKLTHHSFHRNSSKVSTHASHLRRTGEQDTDRRSIKLTGSQNHDPSDLYVPDNNEDVTMEYESYNIDHLASYEQYFKKFNIDTICKQFAKIQKNKKRYILQKHENAHLSKYTFYNTVKQRALRVMKFVKAKEKGIDLKTYNKQVQRNSNISQIYQQGIGLSKLRSNVN